MSSLFEILCAQIASGVLTIGPDCTVLYANAAAQAMVDEVVGTGLAAPWLRMVAQAAQRGHISLPHEFSLRCAKLPGADVRALLVEAPGAQGMLLVLTPTHQQVEFLLAYKNLIQETQRELRETTELWQQTIESGHADSDVERRRRAPLLRMSALVRRMSEAWDALYSRTGAMDERVGMLELVRRATEPKELHFSSLHVSIEIRYRMRAGASIYGNESLLRTCVMLAMECLATAVAPGALMAIVLEQVGTVASVSFTVSGAARVAAVDRSISWSVAELVAMRHGGTLRFDAPLRRVTLALPAGTQRPHDTMIAIRQAERYEAARPELSARFGAKSTP